MGGELCGGGVVMVASMRDGLNSSASVRGAMGARARLYGSTFRRNIYIRIAPPIWEGKY